MAREDLLDQRRTRPWHTDDEYRPVVVQTFEFWVLERSLWKSSLDRLEEAVSVGFLIVQLRALHPTAGNIMFEGLFVLPAVVQRLRIGKVQSEKRIGFGILR